jgi:hypothetical protein
LQRPDGLKICQVKRYHMQIKGAIARNMYKRMTDILREVLGAERYFLSAAYRLKAVHKTNLAHTNVCCKDDAVSSIHRV